MSQPKEGTLVLSALTEAGSGVVTCEASNGVGPAKKREIEIRVLGQLIIN